MREEYTKATSCDSCWVLQYHPNSHHIAQLVFSTVVFPSSTFTLPLPLIVCGAHCAHDTGSLLLKGCTKRAMTRKWD